MRVGFVFFLLVAVSSCRTLSGSKNQEPAPPIPRIPFNPDFKDEPPASNQGSVPEPSTPIPLPPILTEDPPTRSPEPEPAPSPVPTPVPEPRFFHKAPAADGSDELSILLQYGACYAYSETAVDQMTPAQRALLREGECPEALTITAPVKGNFKRAGRCWLTRDSKVVASLSLYNETYVKAPDGQYSLKPRKFVESIAECAKVFGAFRGESDGIKIRDDVSGTGETIAVPTIRLRVHYKMKVPGSDITEDSRKAGEPFDFSLGAGQVISGWDTGLQGMRRGGKRWLSIPPQRAYGESGYGIIPPNATLEFDVELVDILYDVTKSMSLRSFTPPQLVGGSWVGSFEIAKTSTQLQNIPVTCRVRASANFKNKNSATVVFRAESEFEIVMINEGQESLKGSLTWIFDPRLASDVASVDSTTLKIGVFTCEATVNL